MDTHIEKHLVCWEEAPNKKLKRRKTFSENLLRALKKGMFLHKV